MAELPAGVAEAAMGEALAQARLGRGRVEPNPRVGAVLLREGAVVGRGHHRVYGGDHAEVAALADAGGAAADTLVVTLEPCCSPLGAAGKKTPPCTDAIVRAGIRRVVVGALDPDPRHHERGVARLRELGIEVTHGLREAECTALNRPFRRWLGLDVPWVIAKWAMSLDGKIASRTGDSRWISGEASRTRVHEIRAAVDAVLVGWRTAVVDDPELTVRHVAGENPIRVVVDPFAELPPSAKLVATATETPTWILAGPDATAARRSALAALGVQVIEVPGSGRDLDLGAALRDLRSRGIRRLLAEGGGGLFARLFEAGLVHQVTAFVAPLVLGGAEAPTPVSGTGVELLRDAWRFGEVVQEVEGEDLVVHAFAT